MQKRLNLAPFGTDHSFPPLMRHPDRPRLQATLSRLQRSAMDQFQHLCVWRKSRRWRHGDASVNSAQNGVQALALPRRAGRVVASVSPACGSPRCGAAPGRWLNSLRSDNASGNLLARLLARRLIRAAAAPAPPAPQACERHGRGLSWRHFVVRCVSLRAKNRQPKCLSMGTTAMPEYGNSAIAMGGYGLPNIDARVCIWILATISISS